MYYGFTFIFGILRENKPDPRPYYFRHGFQTLPDETNGQTRFQPRFISPTANTDNAYRDDKQ